MRGGGEKGGPPCELRGILGSEKPWESFLSTPSQCPQPPSLKSRPVPKANDKGSVILL